MTKPKKTHCPHGHEYNLQNTTYNSIGHRSCKTCCKERSKKVYWSDPEKQLTWHKKYYIKKRTKILAYKKKYRDAKRHIEAKYNLQTSYANMVANQGGLCATCGKEPDERGLHVDHDHACCNVSKSCGKCVRGLLCHSCNAGLGLLNDSIETLQNMIKYLQEHTKNLTIQEDIG